MRWRTRLAVAFGTVLSCSVGGLNLVDAAAAQDRPQRRLLTAGALESWEPHYSLDASGRPTGFGIEVMEAVAERAGFEVDYELYDSFFDLTQALRDGTIDLIPNYGITEERRREFAFTRPVETFAIGLFVRNEQSGVEGLGDLAGGAVAVVVINAARPIVEAAPGVRAEVYDDPRAALFDLLAGQVDGFAYPIPVVRSLASAAGVEREIRVAGGPLVEIRRAIAVRRDDTELIARLDPAVEALVGSTLYEEIYGRWYGEEPPFWTPRRVGFTMATVLVLTILLMTLWRYRAVVEVNRRLVRAIEERERASRELERSQAKLAAIFEQAQNAIVLADDEARWVDVNPATCRLLGRSRDELIGSYPWDLTPDRNAEDGRRLWERFLEEGTLEGEFPLVDADGKVLYVDYSSVADILPGLHLSIMSDITHRKRAEEERAVLQHQLAQSQKMEAIGTLAGGIAHDFNNILTAILGYADLARREVEEGSVAAVHLETISTAGGRARDLVRQILSFSRQTEQSMRPVRLGSLVDEAAQMLRATLPATIDLELRREVDGLVRADPVQVHQILVNLCTNAMQAMERVGGGVLEIGLDAVDLGRREVATRFPGLDPGRYQLLWVKDEGVGMEDEVRRRIFEPFFTTKEGEQGTGLGLSVVHGIIAAHGGAVSVDSAPGRGSRFDIYLPLLDEALHEEIPEPLAKVPGGRERIMLVDDEETLLDLMGRSLTGLGYEVDAFASPHEALEALRETPAGYDLVLSDVAMPGLGGDELAEEMLTIRSDLPIVLCTGFTERLLGPGEVRRLGVRQLLLKPMLLSELALAVRQALDEPAVAPGD